MLSKTHGRYLLLQQITKVGSGRELNVCMAGFSLLPRPLCFFNSCDFLWYWLVAVICWYCYCCCRCCGWPLHLLTITRNYFCLSLTHMHTFVLFFLVYLCTQTCFYITLLVIFINIVYLHDLARCLFTNDSMHFLVASFVSVRMRNICFVHFSRSCRHVFNSKRIFFSSIVCFSFSQRFSLISLMSFFRWCAF